MAYPDSFMTVFPPHRSHACLLAFAAGLMLSACATAPRQPAISAPATDAADFSSQTLRQRYELAEGSHSLRVVNRYGEINLRGMDELAVGVHATVQRFGADGPLPRLQFTQAEGKASLEVVYDDPRPIHRGRPGRIDLAVYVPQLKHLELVGGDDRIQLRRYGGNVTARSDAGQLQISAWGRLDLASASGEIRAMLLSPPADGEVRIEGSRLVEVLFPPTAELALEVRASELIDDAIGITDSDPDPLVLRRPASASTLRLRGAQVYLRPLHLLDEGR